MVLTGDEITLLCIADSNTKGLTGPAEAGKPFHSLLKDAGVSNKDAADSGGSFGIGKNAAFAVSELQAVFIPRSITMWMTARRGFSPKAKRS